LFPVGLQGAKDTAILARYADLKAREKACRAFGYNEQAVVFALLCDGVFNELSPAGRWVRSAAA
jgi:hypothetical protein